MGIREWPQQTKSSSWVEETKEGKSIVRYILQGSGTVTVGNESSRKFSEGTLIEIQGPCKVTWTKNEGDDIIILTPGFENVGLFVGVILGFTAMVGALLALS